MSTLYRIGIRSSLHFWSHSEGTWDKDPQEYNLLSAYRWLVKENYSCLKDMLRFASYSGMEDRKALHLAEFAYIDNYRSSIEMTPYEAIDGRPCRIPLCWTKVRE